MPWNIKRTFRQLIAHGQTYLREAKVFVETHKAVPNKRLSFHLDEVKCINKSKIGQPYQFGRVFQLGRIQGNFLWVKPCENVHESDKNAMPSMLVTHQTVFQSPLHSVTADKGYYSLKNNQALNQFNVAESAIQMPVNARKQSPLPLHRQQSLYNRRAGIEPLIGHCKSKGQLGKSRMKSDASILASGYCAVLGFNWGKFPVAVKMHISNWTHNPYNPLFLISFHDPIKS